MEAIRGGNAVRRPVSLVDVFSNRLERSPLDHRIEVWFYLLLPVWMAGLWRIGSPIGWAAYWVGSILMLMAWQVGLTRFDAVGLDTAEQTGRELLILGAEWWPTRNPAGLFAHFLFGVLAGALVAGRHHYRRDASPEGGRRGGTAGMSSPWRRRC